MSFLNNLFGAKITPAPVHLSNDEQIWRTFTIGSDIEYMGKKGKIVYNRDLKESNDEPDIFWEGPAYIVMRYVNDIGEFKDIKLYYRDLF